MDCTFLANGEYQCDLIEAYDDTPPSVHNYMYSINVFLYSGKDNSLFKSYRFPNVSSAKTPLLNIRPFSADELMNQTVNVMVQDVTFYMGQPDLILFISTNPDQHPVQVVFQNTVLVANQANRQALIMGIPYKNITLAFATTPQAYSI